MGSNPIVSIFIPKVKKNILGREMTMKEYDHFIRNAPAAL